MNSGLYVLEILDGPRAGDRFVYDAMDDCLALYRHLRRGRVDATWWEL